MKVFKNKIFRILAITLIFSSASVGSLFAQCAMCKASVETNVNVDGIGFAAKLNTGILYLFVTPYLLAMVIGYMWYKKSKEQQQKLKEAEFRKHKISNL